MSAIPILLKSTLRGYITAFAQSGYGLDSGRPRYCGCQASSPYAALDGYVVFADRVVRGRLSAIRDQPLTGRCQGPGSPPRPLGTPPRSTPAKALWWLNLHIGYQTRNRIFRKYFCFKDLSWLRSPQNVSSPKKGVNRVEGVDKLLRFRVCLPVHEWQGAHRECGRFCRTSTRRAFRMWSELASAFACC